MNVAQILLTASLVVASTVAQNESKTPPKGPPWTMDFFAAHRQAVAEGKPIFVYSTKTY